MRRHFHRCGHLRILTVDAGDLSGARKGGESPVADTVNPRAAELRELRSELVEEQAQIVAENRRRGAESAGAVLRNPRPLRSSEEWEAHGAGVSVFLDEELRELQTARLDAIERALDAMARGVYGNCARCRHGIDVARLRETPDTVLCSGCERETLREA